MRPIDADALRHDIHTSYSDDLEILEHIDSAPTIDAEPVKHGYWIVYKADEESKEHMKCSVCGAYWSAPQHAKIFKRCYNCGAKMDLKDGGAEK